MLRMLSVPALGVVGLLTVTAVPAEAGANTGSWRYWSPYTSYPAAPHWREPHAALSYGRGYYHGHGAYAQSRPHWDGYGYRHHAPGW
jgi:hypothetical protein